MFKALETLKLLWLRTDLEECKDIRL